MELKNTISFMLANTTSLLQPVDQGTISAFKSYYLRSTFEKLISALYDDLSGKSKEGKLNALWKVITVLDGIKTIRNAWAELKK
uniref:DDE-1 domain-containing protein n=1 Tax=Anolis carolinensis TaxID=28377 RepID=A0A803SM48_ANOCA